MVEEKISFVIDLATEKEKKNFTTITVPSNWILDADGPSSSIYNTYFFSLIFLIIEKNVSLNRYFWGGL